MREKLKKDVEASAPAEEGEAPKARAKGRPPKLKKVPPPLGKNHHYRPTPKIVEENLRLYERQRQAIELRKAGATYEQIAKQLGYAGRGLVFRDIKLALRDLQEECKLATAEYVALEEARLDRHEVALNGLLERQRGTMSPGDEVKIRAEMRKIGESRRKLFGLDAAQQLELTGSGGGAVAVRVTHEEVLERFDGIRKRLGLGDEPGDVVAVDRGANGAAGTNGAGPPHSGPKH